MIKFSFSAKEQMNYRRPKFSVKSGSGELSRKEFKGLAARLAKMPGIDLDSPMIHSINGINIEEDDLQPQVTSDIYWIYNKQVGFIVIHTRPGETVATTFIIDHSGKVTHYDDNVDPECMFGPMEFKGNNSYRVEFAQPNDLDAYVHHKAEVVVGQLVKCGISRRGGQRSSDDLGSGWSR